VQSVSARLSVMDGAEQPLVADGLATLREAWGAAAAIAGETLSLVAAIVDRAAMQYQATDDAVAHAAGAGPDYNDRAYIGAAEALRRNLDFLATDPDWIDLAALDLAGPGSQLGAALGPGAAGPTRAQ